MGERCEICPRPRVDGSQLCRYHQLAYNRLRKAFESWREALNVDWRDFLEEVLKLPQLGEWAREVALNMLKQPQ
jgi:hypothetical protein